MVAKIADVLSDALLKELGVEAGDVLISINGHPVADILDYKFLQSEQRTVLEIKKPDGEVWQLDIEKDEGDDLGLLFGEAVFDRMKVCRNRCVFCFIDQLPTDMRKTLYVKDDDYRCSFLYGNFITLTNLKEKDWEKIIEMRLSPLYVSVHCLRPELRAQMLNNTRAAAIGTHLKRLYQARIEVHTQVVLCPGLNDGDVLRETIEGLAAYYPSVRSVGIVPVGLTGHRDRLSALNPIIPEQARILINVVNEYQIHYRKQLELGFVYLADEFYTMTGIEIPPGVYYDDFCQLENGIGLARLLLDDFSNLEADLPKRIKPHDYLILTGQAAYPVLQQLGRRLGQIEGLNLEILPVPNRFFGGRVNVTGLLTGSDIIRVLGKKYAGREIILPAVVLKEASDLFLDGLSVSQVREQTGAEFIIIEEVDELISLLRASAT